MKSDNYLSLCLDQAAKSPLHYRHGCIIVRGGKVIGQGFNDYRPGYDGGSLKNGRVANGAFDGPAVADLKTKLKKQKNTPKEKQQNHSFFPFEGTGGGHGANKPLSMHSEMMAIHSALAASSTLSCSAMSPKKPCFKLPSGDKRKARLRRETLAAYVNAVCETAQRSGQPQILHHNYHNTNVQQDRMQQSSDEEDWDRRRQDEAQRVKETGLAFHPERSGEKHHQNNQNEKTTGKKADRYEYQYDRYGHQTQQAQPQPQPSVSKRQGGHGIRGYDLASTKSTSMNGKVAPGNLQHEKRKKDYKRSGKLRKASSDESAQPEPMLLPKGQTSSSARSVADREKHPRLHGADMYVARLGWCGAPAARPVTGGALTNAPATAVDDVVAEASSSRGDVKSSSTTSPPSTISSSLHDELLNRTPSPVRTRSAGQTHSINTVRASRPCYRCITYMHSVGIKRVFWTNDSGEWEGGKVRDLVDALDRSMENVAITDGPGGMGGPTGNGVFVTKHEVLMLKRMMGKREERGK